MIYPPAPDPIKSHASSCFLMATPADTLSSERISTEVPISSQDLSVLTDRTFPIALTFLPYHTSSVARFCWYFLCVISAICSFLSMKQADTWTRFFSCLAKLALVTLCTIVLGVKFLTLFKLSACITFSTHLLIHSFLQTFFSRCSQFHAICSRFEERHLKKSTSIISLLHTPFLYNQIKRTCNTSYLMWYVVYRQQGLQIDWPPSVLSNKPFWWCRCSIPAFFNGSY